MNIGTPPARPRRRECKCPRKGFLFQTASTDSMQLAELANSLPRVARSRIQVRPRGGKSKRSLAVGDNYITESRKKEEPTLTSEESVGRPLSKIIDLSIQSKVRKEGGEEEGKKGP